MKLFFLPLLFLFAFSCCELSAQENLNLKNEIQVGYGQTSARLLTLEFKYGLENFSNAFFSSILGEYYEGGLTKTDKFTTTGSAFLTYKYYLEPRWSIGAQGVFERIEDNVNFSNGESINLRFDAYSLLIRTDYYWIDKSWFKFYSGVAIGGGLSHKYQIEDHNKQEKNAKLAFSCTPAGIRFGKQIGCFIEGGYGWDGAFRFGISGKF